MSQPSGEALEHFHRGELPGERQLELWRAALLGGACELAPRNPTDLGAKGGNIAGGSLGYLTGILRHSVRPSYELSDAPLQGFMLQNRAHTGNMQSAALTSQLPWE